MKNIEDEFEMQSRIINKVWDEDEPEALIQHDVSGAVCECLVFHKAFEINDNKCWHCGKKLK
jgi:hypothetical protein